MFDVCLTASKTLVHAESLIEFFFLLFSNTLNLFRSALQSILASRIFIIVSSNLTDIGKVPLELFEKYIFLDFSLTDFFLTFDSECAYKMCFMLYAGKKN